MTCLPLGLSYKGEVLLAFEFAVFSGRFKLLSKDGLLATFSCSHHVNDATLLETISDALVDARRSARRLRRFDQAPDHPVLPTIPETEYFRGFLLEMMPGR